MLEVVAIFPVALLAVPHCAAMCGPLAACATRCQPSRQVGYQIGRVAGYGIAGAIAGGLGQKLGQLVGGPWITAVATWLVALALVATALSMLARPGAGDVVALRPRRRGVAGAVLGRGPVALFGLLTVLLPCGALWAALAIAVSTGSMIGGAVAMVVFAAITGVAVSAAASIVARLRRGRWLFAAALVSGAVLLAIAPAAQLGADASAAPACPLHQTR